MAKARFRKFDTKGKSRAHDTYSTSSPEFNTNADGRLRATAGTVVLNDA